MWQLNTEISPWGVSFHTLEVHMQHKKNQHSTKKIFYNHNIIIIIEFQKLF